MKLKSIHAAVNQCKNKLWPVTNALHSTTYDCLKVEVLNLSSDFMTVGHIYFPIINSTENQTHYLHLRTHSAIVNYIHQNEQAHSSDNLGF